MADVSTNDAASTLGKYLGIAMAIVSYGLLAYPLLIKL